MSHLSASQPLDGAYTTPLLPELSIEVARLWRVPLPTVRDIVRQLDAVLS